MKVFYPFSNNEGIVVRSMFARQIESSIIVKTAPQAGL